MLTDGRSKSPLIAENHARCPTRRKKPTRKGPRIGLVGEQAPQRTSYAEYTATIADWCDVARVTIDMLPGVVLLEVFDFYVNEVEWKQKWLTLVHVCQKWRTIVFGSPRRLGLRLVCTDGIPVKESLDIWPPLPIVIRHDYYPTLGVDSVIAALKHNDRVREIKLGPIPSLQWEEVLATMQKPFPVLTHLELGIEDEIQPVDSLFGGCAPRLQTLSLDRIPFPGLPKLLLSTVHLVHLDLWRIPHSGYISPEVMANSLSVLTRLESLFITFESPRSHTGCKRQRPSPASLPTRTLVTLPALTELYFKGASEYLEDLVAQIDTPRLDNLSITFFHQLIFDTPQLTKFINRAPKFKAHDEARVFFDDRHVRITFPQTLDESLELAISCRQPDWQISSLAQVCSLSFPQALIPAVKHLYICDGRYSKRLWQGDIENSQWLELLHPFTGVKSLYLSREFEPRIAPALKELVGERVTEVLPALEKLYLEDELHTSGPLQEAIWHFYYARLFSDHRIVLLRWGRKK